ncbi:MAG: hypothetical protein IPK19_26410 [Chloroflexi bacterium]|nr:hypothetical protein [Chloroflexota bacterium]
MQRILLILTLFTLAACGMLNPTGSSTTGGAAPILQIAQSPADVVRAFLDNWNGKNRQGMYDLLSGTSRGMITFAAPRQHLRSARAGRGSTRTAR